MSDVHVLVTCRGWEHVRLSTLVFDSIRTGFPGSDIHVTINGVSAGAAASEHVEDELHQDGVAASIRRLPGEIEHGRWIRDIVYGTPDGPVVFVDTDVVFWKNCEDLVGIVRRAGKLYGGRYIPWISPCDNLTSPPRIHPSLFVVPDVRALREALAPLYKRVWYFRPFEGYGVYNDSNGSVVCHDTCSALYAALPGKAYVFLEQELDRYDHLFAGTYPDLFEQMGMRQDLKRSLRSSHEIAKTDPGALRGIWRSQGAPVPDITRE